MLNRSRIADEARTWLGVPWRHQGRTRAGIDCVGLVVQVANALDLNPHGYDSTDYARRSGGLELARHFKGNMVEKSIADIQCGDVILLRDNAYPCHVGIASERYDVLYMIHAYAPGRKVIEELFGESWRAKAVLCFAFHNVE